MPLALIAIDGSEHSIRAFNFCIEKLLDPDKWNLLLLHVIDERDLNMVLEVVPLVRLPVFESQEVSRGNVVDNMKKKAEELLENLVEKANKQGFKCSFEIRTGIPHDEIIKTSEEKDVDLIVLGSRGLRGFEKILVGSVSSYVVSHARKPVLIVPPKK